MYTSGPAASNKPNMAGSTASSHVITGTVAYNVPVSPDQVITVTASIIDKLSLTLPVGDDPTTVAAVKNALAGLSDSNKAPPTGKAKLGPTKYRTNVHLLHAPSGQHILVQADPTSNLAFLRFEMNPAKLGADGVRFWRNNVAEIFGHADASLNAASKATVTRIDLACDLINVRIDSLAFKANVSGKTITYIGMKGRLETIYMAVKAHKSGEISGYNKKRQLKDQGLESQYGDLQHTRVEVRVLARRPITQLTDMKNPFRKVEVTYLPRTAPSLPLHVWRHFTDAVRYRGLTAALEPIPAHLRDAYLAGLNGLASPLWQPDLIWAKWPRVLAASGLLAD